MPTPLALLFSAPHRVLFLPGALQCVLTMLYWLAVLLGRIGLVPVLPEPALPATAAHLWLMLYGIFPFFIFGFLFTAVPNWLDAPKPQPRAYLTVALPMTLGAGLFYAGLWLPGATAVGIGLHLLGWLAALPILWRLLRSARARSPQTAGPPRHGTLQATRPVLIGEAGARPAVKMAEGPDRRHAWIALLACTLGLGGEASFLCWLSSDIPRAWLLAETLGLWGFLTPLFLAVCHRMIPWFTSRVVPDYPMVRPSYALWAMLLGCLVHAGIVTADLMAWTWLADLPLAALLFWLSRRWHAAGIHRVRLLSMLHIGFLWSGLAFTLHGIDSLARLLDAGWNLGHAPVHALGIGFYASMLLAMATRVSLGHSGRRLEADVLTWVLFWLVQTSALARMLPDFFPALTHPAWMTPAAVVWLTAFALWAWRYAPFYWRARVDGMPG